MGQPTPQSRPRILRCGRSYSPKAKLQKDIAMQLKAQMQDQSLQLEPPITEPVSMAITFFMAIPKSMSRVKRAALKGKPCITKNGDLTNLIKLIEDAANQVIFVDDCQVYDLTATKIYSETPRTEITVVVYTKVGQSLQEHLFS